MTVASVSLIFDSECFQLLCLFDMAISVHCQCRCCCYGVILMVYTFMKNYLCCFLSIYISVKMSAIKSSSFILTSVRFLFLDTGFPWKNHFKANHLPFLCSITNTFLFSIIDRILNGLPYSKRHLSKFHFISIMYAERVYFMCYEKNISKYLQLVCEFIWIKLHNISNYTHGVIESS